MKKQVELVIEKPTLDFWTKSLTQILNSIPGDHTGYTPIAIVNKYFFDYAEEGEYGEPLSKPVAWESRNLKTLASKVTKRFGAEYVNLIEPKLVLICEVSA